MNKAKHVGLWLMASPVFWITLVLCALVGFIGFFERYTQVGVDSVYHLF